MKKACANHCKRKVDTMPSSPSDHDMSDSSSSGASYVKYSPYNSPSQQVPQLTNELTELTCVDKRQFLQHGTTKPFLRITEQPQNHFRFRYISEMVGTHGCLLGKSYSTNKTKTHPTVELVNYNGQALIRCQLAQHDNPEDHPHKLLEDEQDRDVSQHVPEQGSYKVAFGGIGIIHTAKKDVSALLLKKFMEQNRYPNINLRDLQTKCDNMAKSINLNIVRLKFSAHDGLTGEEICEPVFSELIHNMKSASTNDLKICRMSCFSGSASGGEDVFILVEKVNKKNIMIRFYELDMNGERTWEAIGQFMQTDVHHQYAIVFRTPSYKDRQTPVDVEVFIELVRPSDGRTSEPKTFKYRADPVFMQKKKRKANSSVCSIGNSPNGSLNSSCDIPITVINQQDAVMDNAVPTVPSLYSILSQAQMVFPTPPSQCDLGSALAGSETSQSPASSPMWGAPHAVLPPTEVTFANLQLNSAELADMLQHTDPDTAILSEGMKVFFSEYLKSCSEESPVDKLGSLEFRPENIVKDSGQPSTVKVEKLGSLQFRPANIVKDSGRPSTVKVEITDEIQAQSGLGSSPKSDTPATSNSKDVKPDINKNTTGYDAFYNTEDGTQVKKLIKDLCDMIRNKKGYKKQEVRSRLERLFNIRLSNGDTFLHMTLCSNLATLDYIVKIIHNVKATHLLDYYNLRRQTPLHVAILNDAPKTVALLVSRGASPMMKDEQGLNAIHYAVKYKSCLIPLLDTIKKYNVMCDLDDTNRERQSALHLAVVSGSETSAEALLRAGASHAARDTLGRTPLHIAAYDDRLAAIRTLLEHIPLSEVDVVDDAGNTALQIVCGGQTMRENTIAIATLLLEKKANPLKTEEGNESAWRLVRHKPELKALLEKYVGEDVMDDIDVKSEPDDDFESADEGEYAEVCLGELSLYLRELAARLDAAGAWRDLAARLRLDALTDWYGSQPSPTRSLLAHLKDSRDDISSKSLMLILEDMGQTEAADVIRRYIE